MSLYLIGLVFALLISVLIVRFIKRQRHQGGEEIEKEAENLPPVRKATKRTARRRIRRVKLPAMLREIESLAQRGVRVYRQVRFDDDGTPIKAWHDVYDLGGFVYRASLYQNGCLGFHAIVPAAQKEYFLEEGWKYEAKMNKSPKVRSRVMRLVDVGGLLKKQGVNLCLYSDLIGLTEEVYDSNGLVVKIEVSPHDSCEYTVYSLFPQNALEKAKELGWVFYSDSFEPRSSFFVQRSRKGPTHPRWYEQIYKAYNGASRNDIIPVVTNTAPPSTVEVGGQRYEVKSWAHLLYLVVDFMVKDGRIKAEHVPLLIPHERAAKNFLITKEPFQPLSNVDPERQRGFFKPLSNGWFLWTYFSAGDLLWVIGRLIKQFGYEVQEVIRP